MAEIVKETVRVERTNDNEVVTKPTMVAADESVPTLEEPNVSSLLTVQYLVYFIFGMINLSLIFRLILKLLGANPSSGFVDFVYDVSGVFVAPFAGIFSSRASEGLETVAVFEPASLVAILVYMILAYGVVQLIKIVAGKEVS